jgi:hypothetical protein
MSSPLTVSSEMSVPAAAKMHLAAAKTLKPDTRRA